jgi:hypothetical protein
MSTSKEAVLIKGGILLFAAGLSSGRLFLQVSNGNRSGLVYGLISILLIPLLIVDGVCLGKLINVLKQPLPASEKRKLALSPLLFIVVSILGLITGFITFGVA